MYKKFNNGNVLTKEIKYNNSIYEIDIFEESLGDEESKIEYNFNLIAIEFKNKKPSFLREDKNHYGYIVEVSNNKINNIYLLIEDIGWIENENIILDYVNNKEEIEFIQNIIKDENII